MNGLQNWKTIAVLVVLAAGIWGGILWRLVGYTGREKPVVSELSSPSPVAPAGQDTLRLDYRDPFVKVLPAPKPMPVVTIQEEPPSFRLSGIIRKGKKDFLLFEYPDGSIPVWEKGKVDGYTIGKIHTDSVVVHKAGRSYTLMLN